MSWRDDKWGSGGGSNYDWRTTQSGIGNWNTGGQKVGTGSMGGGINPIGGNPPIGGVRPSYGGHRPPGINWDDPSIKWTPVPPGINWDDPSIKWTPVPPVNDPLSSISRPPDINWDNPNIHWSPVGGGLPSGINRNVNQNNQGDPNHTADPGRMGPMAALPPALPPAQAVHPAHQAFQSFFDNVIREGGGGGMSAPGTPNRPSSFPGRFGGAPETQTGITRPPSTFKPRMSFGNSGEGFFGERR